jgi:hypothetical protein
MGATRHPAARVEDEGDLLSVYDGQRLLGHVLESPGRCTARSWPDEIHLGEFRNRREAADAISAAAAQAARPSKPRAG